MTFRVAVVLFVVFVPSGVRADERAGAVVGDDDTYA